MASEYKKLFCCPEDWACDLIAEAQADGRQPRNGQSLAEWHDELCGFHDRFLADRGIVRMCSRCKVPICRSCSRLLWQANGKSNVPMALANDNWYGYVQDIIARMDVRWIECACASICWTTQIIYQLEEPYGHPIQNSVRGAQSRTAARGNMFSFTMPWEDILQNLQAALDNSAKVPMPHDGKVLSLLVRLHLVGTSVNISKHVKELEIRTEVVIQLMRELIARGFPGYSNYRIDDVERRTHELFGYGSKAGFVPKEVLQEVERSAKLRARLSKEPWDKNATPAEPASADATVAFAAARPQHIVAERDGDVGLCVNASRNKAFGEFGDLEIKTGSDLIDQWKSEYLCSAMPFALALPVGGYDVRGQGRWRRSEDAAPVKLEDLVKGLPRRVEAQFRRHWWFILALWNLYFRERVNFSQHLSMRHKQDLSAPMSFDDQDAARAAKRIYHRLEAGTFTDASGARRPIAGDTSKVYFADGTTQAEQRLLRNVEFVGGSIPGTQAIRRRMGRLGFSASIVYGSGIFITISPSERHNTLAIKLSRYRSSDPLLAPSHCRGHQTRIACARHISYHNYMLSLRGRTAGEEQFSLDFPQL